MDLKDGKTKLKTSKDYISLHAGPKYEMNLKMSHLLTAVYMTMFFGFSLPILYPITLVGLIVFYFTDISLLFYFYQIPPSYDEKINSGVLKILEFAPYFSLVLAIW